MLGRAITAVKYYIVCCFSEIQTNSLITSISSFYQGHCCNVTVSQISRHHRNDCEEDLDVAAPVTTTCDICFTAYQ